MLNLFLKIFYLSSAQESLYRKWLVGWWSVVGELVG
jgi:hypothetical protein